jgi:hypothetical protein
MLFREVELLSSSQFSLMVRANTNQWTTVQLNNPSRPNNGRKGYCHEY